MRPTLPARRRHPRSVLGAFVLLGASAAVAVLVLGSHRSASRDDGFCLSCHPTDDVHPEFTAAGHDEIACAGCHSTTPGESAVLGLARAVRWRSGSSEHSIVPDVTCASCHVEGDPDDRLIAGTIGHEAHLSDHVPEVRDIRCATCHDATSSRPTEATCTTSGCHEDVQVELAGMSRESDLECILCHDFLAARVEGDSLSAHGRARAPSASADGTGVDYIAAALQTGPWAFPSRIRNRPHDTCFECHAGQRAEAHTVKETAHGGLCAACHDPHHHTEPAEALQSCARLGCHATPERESPYHRGLDTDVLPRCEVCHEAHTWGAPGTAEMLEAGVADGASNGVTDDAPSVVDALLRSSDEAAECVACHSRDVFREGGIFNHRRHANVDCARCHLGELGRVHGELVVWAPSDCMACHHVDVAASACAECHTPDEIGTSSPLPWSFDFTVWEKPAVRRIGFDHDDHADVACLDCHQDREDLGKVPDCASCHDDHHAADVTCATCHTVAPEETHTVEVHFGCEGSGCHQASAVTHIQSAREVCLVCHQDQREHEMGEACGGCHQLETFPLDFEGGHGR